MTRGRARLVARVVPWTRRVAERQTRYDGPRDRPRALRRRATARTLVLKPAHGYGGQSVLVGDETDAAVWEEAVTAALAEPWVVQRRVAIPEEPFPVLDGGALALRAAEGEREPVLRRRGRGGRGHPHVDELGHQRERGRRQRARRSWWIDPAFPSTGGHRDGGGCAGARRLGDRDRAPARARAGGRDHTARDAALAARPPRRGHGRHPRRRPAHRRGEAAGGGRGRQPRCAGRGRPPRRLRDPWRVRRLLRGPGGHGGHPRRTAGAGRRDRGARQPRLVARRGTRPPCAPGARDRGPREYRAFRSPWRRPHLACGARGSLDAAARHHRRAGRRSGIGSPCSC